MSSGALTAASTGSSAGGAFTPRSPPSCCFPFLRNYEFFARSASPWIAELESATDGSATNCWGCSPTTRKALSPTLPSPTGCPLRQWQDLNHSRRWSAYFLFNQGRREETHLARCPRTAAMLQKMPQVDITGRGPRPFSRYSMPAPRFRRTPAPPTRGPYVHLPLIVSPGCRFRVGGETREWQVGTAWLFDDTLSTKPGTIRMHRAILIFDVWNPELTQLSAICPAKPRLRCRTT